MRGPGDGDPGIQKEKEEHCRRGPDNQLTNSELQRSRTTTRSKLILSSTVHDWKLRGIIDEKNLSQSKGFEFGYAFGFRETTGALASGKEFAACAEEENFIAGLEFYGGIGQHEGFGVNDTAH